MGKVIISFFIIYILQIGLIKRRVCYGFLNLRFLVLTIFYKINIYFYGLYLFVYYLYLSLTFIGETDNLELLFILMLIDYYYMFIILYYFI